MTNHLPYHIHRSILKGLLGLVESHLLVIEMQQNGLDWYRENYPEANSEADYEMSESAARLFDRTAEHMISMLLTFLPPEDVQARVGNTVNISGLVFTIVNENEDSIFCRQDSMPGVKLEFPKFTLPREMRDGLES